MAALLPTVHHGAGITYVELLFTILGVFFRRATMKFNIFVLRLRIMVTHGEYSLIPIYLLSSNSQACCPGYILHSAISNRFFTSPRWGIAKNLASLEKNECQTFISK